MVVDSKHTREGDATAVREPSPPFVAQRRRLGSLELPIITLALCVLAAFVYAPHVEHGGFYLDDWANASLSLYPPGGGITNALSAFSNETLYRPVLVLYVPFTYFVFGTHMALQLVWSTVLSVIASLLFYGLLRNFKVPMVHACMIAALALVYPWSDSTRLWETADQAILSIDLAFGGLWVALIGLRRSSWRLHSSAACLYLFSILAYEITLPLIAFTGCLYVVRYGWKIARSRWSVDLIVVVVGGLWVGTNTNHEKLGLSADLHHFGEIVEGGATLLGRTLIPLGEPPRTTLALAVCGAILLLGLAVQLFARARAIQAGKWGLNAWLPLTGTGIALAALGWIMLTPANPYYTPSVYGVTNRVNSLATYGLVLAIYGVLGTACALIKFALPRWHGLLYGLPILLGLLLGAAYVRVTERHIRVWDTAFQAEMAGIKEIKRQFPTLPPGTTVFTSNYPANQTLGVPIFSASWDVNGMVKLQYKDGTLSAYPVLPGLRLACRADGVLLEGPGAPPTIAIYGKARFLNMQTGRHVRPRDEKECMAVSGSYTPGPLYIWLTY